MGYNPINWKNKGEGGAKPIDANNLNIMEKGIIDALRKDGGTMTGELILHGNPVQTMEAVPKSYADKNIKFIDFTNINKTVDQNTPIGKIPDWDDTYKDKYIAIVVTRDFHSSSLEPNYITYVPFGNEFTNVSDENSSLSRDYMKIYYDGNIFLKHMHNGSFQNSCSTSDIKMLLLIPVDKLQLA